LPTADKKKGTESDIVIVIFMGMKMEMEVGMVVGMIITATKESGVRIK